MRILQVFRKPEDGSLNLLLGANRSILSITQNNVSKLSLPGGSEDDSSTAYVTNIVTAEQNSSVFATFDDKAISKWNMVTGELSGTVTLKKKANAMTCGTVQGQDIVIIGDKVGDMWGFQSKQMCSLGYLGGHPVSIITDVTVNKINTLLAGSDRDEKIKISSFPLVEEVQGYLLGHKSVVTSISFVDEEGQFLVSAAWDHKVILWNTSTCTPSDEYSFKENDATTESATAGGATTSAATEAVTEDDGEDGEKEKDYNEASAGNYPFKIAVSSTGLVAVLCKNEKKITVLRATTVGEAQSLELVGSFATAAQPVDCSFVSANELAVVFPHPTYINIFSIGADMQDVTEQFLSASVIESFNSLLGASFSSAALFKSLGFEDDKNLMRDQLDNPVRALPKGGYVPNKKSRK